MVLVWTDGEREAAHHNTTTPLPQHYGHQASAEKDYGGGQRKAKKGKKQKRNKIKNVAVKENVVKHKLGSKQTRKAECRANHPTCHAGWWRLGVGCVHTWVSRYGV